MNKKLGVKSFVDNTFKLFFFFPAIFGFVVNGLFIMNFHFFVLFFLFVQVPIT